MFVELSFTIEVESLLKYWLKMTVGLILHENLLIQLVLLDY